MLKKIVLLFICQGFVFAGIALAQNVNPTIIDATELENAQKERERIFNELIEEPTNMDNLFKYANLSILVGDLEAAVGVFEQMLIYDEELPRIRLELGVLYYRLSAFSTAKTYLESVKRYDPPAQVIENVENFLSAITDSERIFKFNSVIGTSVTHSSNGNSGLDAEIINIAGYPFLVSPDTRQQPDISRSLSYTLSINHDLKHPRGDTARYILSLSDTKQDEFKRFDLQAMVFSASRQYNLSADEGSLFTSPSIAPSFSAFKVFLDGEGLLTSSKLATTFSGVLNQKTSAAIEVFLDERDFLGSDIKSGSMQGFTLSGNRFIEKYEANAQIKYGYDNFNANIDSENYGQHAFQISASRTMYLSILQIVGVDPLFREGWRVAANLTHRRKNHASGTEIFALRKDRVNSFQLSASRAISECWVSNFSYRYNKSKSTVDLFNIKNKQINMDFSYVCLNN